MVFQTSSSSLIADNFVLSFWKKWKQREKHFQTSHTHCPHQQEHTLPSFLFVQMKDLCSGHRLPSPLWHHGFCSLTQDTPLWLSNLPSPLGHPRWCSRTMLFLLRCKSSLTPPLSSSGSTLFLVPSDHPFTVLLLDCQALILTTLPNQGCSSVTSMLAHPKVNYPSSYSLIYLKLLATAVSTWLLL